MGNCTGISFVDSTPIGGCNQRGKIGIIKEVVGNEKEKEPNFE